MEDELTKLIIAQLPNFVGLLVCVAFMWKQNQELIKLLRECHDSKQSETDLE